MKRLRQILPLILLHLALAACVAQPDVMVVEITRIVEIEKEVTRIVEVPVTVPAGAPAAVPGLSSLQVELWPDYDRPAVLVLLTGETQDGVPLPAALAIPVPPDAEINAVAQIGEEGMASIEFETADGYVLFTSDAPAFRVEYYAPYQRDGRTRSYEFAWQAPFSVAEMSVQIQQPANATDLVSEPEVATVFTEPSDGLDYHRYNPLATVAGTRYGMRFSYTMESDGLTVDEPGNAGPDLPGGPLHDQQARNNATVAMRAPA